MDTRLINHTTAYSSAASYLVPASPTSRLLLALLSPFREEIAWSLSRLIHASNFYPDHLILSEWCGLADRLLQFVDRLNRAARGEKGWQWEEEEALKHADDWDEGTDQDSDDFDYDEDDDLDLGNYAQKRRRRIGPATPERFDPRSNEQHYFILNAAISASLILRNAVQNDVNAQFISKRRDVVRIAFESVSLPEDLFGFEGVVEDGNLSRRSVEDEEDLRLEGIREMRLYWLDISQTLAERIKVHTRADVVRFANGDVERIPSVTRVPEASLSRKVLSVVHGNQHVAEGNDGEVEDDADVEEDDEDDDEEPVHTAKIPSQRQHSSDRLFTHMVLLLHTTSDRAVLLAVLGFLAQLASSPKTPAEVLVERASATPTRQDGLSPGVVSRCKELLPLTDVDESLADGLLDCLAAFIDICIEQPNPASAGATSHPAAPVNADSALAIEEEEPETRWEWPNALKLISANRRRPDSNASEGVPLSQPATFLLARLLGFKATAWDRNTPVNIHPVLHAARYYPSRRSHDHHVAVRNPIHADADERWRRLRENKAESALVEYTTSAERRTLSNLPEPKRLQEWLKLVTRVNTAPEAGAYITQMQIWTSYRDTFDPLVKASQQQGGQPLPALMPAADVISSVTSTMQGTSAVLRPEEDRAVATAGSQKFVIASLEGNLRPEVRRWNCYWRGCPSPRTDTAEAQQHHIQAHIHHQTTSGRRPLRCQWATCRYALPADVTASSSDLDQQKLMVAHVRTHLPSGDAAEAQSALKAADSGTPPAHSNNAHVQADGVRARSSKYPSRSTIDRPSSIHFKVYRTPFDPVRNQPNGPAYNAARILQTVSRMCRRVLGDDDGTGFEEDDFDREEKKLKLDFSDRLQQDKLGMPFVLPKNFHTTVVAATGAQGAEDSADTSGDLLEQGDGSGLVAGAGAEASAHRKRAEAAAAAEARADSLLALHELISIEDDLMKWAGANDILSAELVEVLDNVSQTKGLRARSLKRSR